MIPSPPPAPPPPPSAPRAADARVRRRVIVVGRVQGVGYRMSCAHRAEAAGLSGHVTNRADGTVEAEFEGPAAAVDALVDWCRRGPPAARVTRVDVDERTAGGAGGFEVR